MDRVRTCPCARCGVPLPHTDEGPRYCDPCLERAVEQNGGRGWRDFLGGFVTLAQEALDGLLDSIEAGADPYKSETV